MDDTTSLPLARLDEINLSLDRAGSVADLVLSYATTNGDGLPNLASGTLLNSMHIIQGELDGIRKALKSAQGSKGEKADGDKR